MSPLNKRLSIELNHQVDLICDRFESCWKSGSRPAIGEFLSSETRLPPETLLLELIQIDMHYRRKQGETPDARDYLPQFPDHSDAILKLSTANEITMDVGRLTGREQLQEHAQDRRFGRYELHQELGCGGFGVVWRAWDTQLQRWVALKIARVSNSTEIRRLFHKEARAMASMNHPHVVRVFDSGIEANLAFITSELVEGESLAVAAQRRQLSQHQILQYTIQIASGLEHVHANSILHRDLKPANILLNHEDSVMIADFGLARHGSMDSTIMQPGYMMGTLHYMSPEQVLGQQVDQTTDIYALGVILFWLLTGQFPFDGSREEIRHKILNELPRDLRELNPEVSPSLSSVCLKAMATDPKQRYQSASLFRYDVEALLAGETVVIRPPWLTQPWLETLRGNRRTVLQAAASLGALGMCGIVISKLLTPPELDPESGPIVPRPAPPPTAAAVPDTLQTFPPGAHLVLHPISLQTGLPDPKRRIVVEEPTPVEMELMPGDYLVVASLDDGRFHEVYRHVPGPGGRGVPGLAYNHLFARFETGRWLLPTVSLPDTDPTEGMSLIPKMSAFVLVPYLPQEYLKKYSIPELYVDQYEYTQGPRRDAFRHDGFRDQYVIDGPEFPLRMNHDFDQFVSLAENLGKRLLSDVEFDFIATNGGTTRYPWGDELAPAAATVGPEITPVGQPVFDRTQHEIPVCGLCSGVAEWVDTQPVFEMPGKPAEILPIHQNYYIIKGGSERVLEGDMQVTAADRNPRDQVIRDRGMTRPGLGCRFARSARPRINAEDFVTRLDID